MPVLIEVTQTRIDGVRNTQAYQSNSPFDIELNSILKYVGMTPLTLMWRASSDFHGLLILRRENGVSDSFWIHDEWRTLPIDESLGISITAMVYWLASID